jgi:hypothetical protein
VISTESKVGIDWELSENGMIGQSLSDMQDPNHRIFTAAAQNHNQTIHDQKDGYV